MKSLDEKIHLHYEIDSKDFSSAGNASSDVKKVLKQIGVSPECARRVAIAMYEGEINMVIHANGGTADVYIYPNEINIVLSDKGPGIENIELAMKEGYSTASADIRSLGFGAGMGLPNMKKYTDNLEIKSQIGVGTNVYLSFKM